MATYKVRSAFALNGTCYRPGDSKDGVFCEFDCDDKKTAQRMIDAGYLHPNKGQKRTPQGTTKSKPRTKLRQSDPSPPNPRNGRATRRNRLQASQDDESDEIRGDDSGEGQTDGEGEGEGQTEDQVTNDQVDGQQSG